MGHADFAAGSVNTQLVEKLIRQMSVQAGEDDLL